MNRESEEERGTVEKKKERVTIHKLPKVFQQMRLLLYGNQEEEDWNKIKQIQSDLLIMMMIQNGISSFLVLTFIFSNMFKYVSIPFPLDIALIGGYLYTLFLIQFGDKDTYKPPANYRLFTIHFLLRTILIIWITFTYPRIHFEYVIVISLINNFLIFLFYQCDKSKYDNCFSVWNNKWRIMVIFLLEEISVNLFYVVNSSTEVFLWFSTFFFLYVQLLLHIQLVPHRIFMKEYNNEFYLSILCFDSDIIFPIFLIKVHFLTRDRKNPKNALILA